MSINQTLRIICLMISLVLPCGLVQAQDSAESGSTETDSSEAIRTDQDRLNAIAAQVSAKINDLKQLRAALGKLSKSEDDTQIKDQIKEAQAGLQNLRTAFSQLATKGVTFEKTSDTPNKKYSWQDELVEVIRPVLGGLKDLTEKPRRIEEARTQISAMTEQKERAAEALKALSGAPVDSLVPAAAAELAAVKDQWKERESNAVNAIEVATIQLQALESKTLDYQDVIIEPIKAFLIGRGLTVLIALATAIIVWYVLSNAFRPITRRFLTDLKRSDRRTRERALAYLYRGVVFAAVLLSVLVVFYVRSDMLLLALSLLLLAGLAVTMRSFVPAYIGELRLLVNAGSVREGERLIFEGLPMEVTSINTFAILRNPSLEGIIRLPLGDLRNLKSRPAGEEPWFPCEVGDTLLLSDGALATVMRQTLEIIQLRIAGTVIDSPSPGFAGSSPKNLSRDGYVLPITFGIDYKHQDICLTEVPPALTEAVQTALGQSTVAPHIISVSVTFKEAATNSLDYLILVSVSGEAATAYYAIGRLVQHALVEVCNERDWGIPFSQLTVHVASGQQAAPEVAGLTDGA